jgi:hypothetical protein
MRPDHGAVGTSETSVFFYRTIRRNISKDSHLHTRHLENLKPRIQSNFIACNSQYVVPLQRSAGLTLQRHPLPPPVRVKYHVQFEISNHTFFYSIPRNPIQSSFCQLQRKNEKCEFDIFVREGTTARRVYCQSAHGKTVARGVSYFQSTELSCRIITLVKMEDVTPQDTTTKYKQRGRSVIPRNMSQNCLILRREDKKTKWQTC